MRLLLVHREATQALGDLDAQADAWFLDGFAPARNPSMWTQRLFRLLFARSRPGALIASYSVAGEVQRRLASAGFIPQRVPGFGRKREALAGRRRGDWQPLYRRAPRALIVGAGLAGGFCSEALRKRGLDAPLVGGAAGKASDVPQLAVFPQLAVRAEERHRLSLAACRYMLDAPGLRRTGVIRLPKNQAEAARFRRIAEQFPDDFIEWRDGRLHYHQAGWWSFADFAEALGLAPRDAWATRIWQAGDGWRCQLEDGSQLRADALVLATGADNALIGNPLGLHWVRGQALSVPGLDLQQVITGPASLFPPRQGRSVISGSYARGRGLAPSDADTRALLKAAAELLPKTDLNPKDATTYVGIRAATRDRLPAVGTLPLALLAPAKGAKSAPAPEAPDFPEASQPSGLYLCNGFGSHGATQARLCAEHLVSKLLGEPSPLSRAQQKFIAPERFAIRDSRASRQSSAP